jgi:uncharacterized membrane protein
VKTASRLSAFVAYLLPVVGWIYVFVLRRKDRFAIFHAKQAVMLIVAAIAAPLVWAVAAWLAVRVPILGPMAAAGTFALVIAAFLLLLVAWIVGMANALRGQVKFLPIVGRWAVGVLGD